MGRRKNEEQHMRKLLKLGGGSLGLTLPIEMVRSLGWKQNQKLTAKKTAGGIMVRDWRKK